MLINTCGRGKRISRSLSRVFLPFLFEDVIYAILPITVLAGVLFHTNTQIDGHFFVIKEWSFANIVLFGVAIRRIIGTNIKQIQPRAYFLNSVVQLIIALLIASVLVLTLVILLERQLLNIDQQYLAIAQLVLFAMAIMTVFSTYLFEEKYYQLMRKVPDQPHFRQYLVISQLELKRAEQYLTTVADSVDHLCESLDTQNYFSNDTKDLEDLQHSLAHISKVANKAENILEKLRSSGCERP